MGSANKKPPQVSVQELGGTVVVNIEGADLASSPRITKTDRSLPPTAPPVAPVADFYAPAVSGTAPLTVRFYDQSTGSPVTRRWDFKNDGTAISYETNPTYTFTEPGTYSVKLSVVNPTGSDEEVKTGYITVSADLPVADFHGDVLSGTAPLTVAFTDDSTGSPTSWLWDFKNDGSETSTDQNPTFTYTEGGAYSVKLRATNDAGFDEIVKIAYINVAPVAAFHGLPLSGTAPLEVTFTDDSTGSPTSWLWDFKNDGSETSTDQNPSHIYTTPGTYAVKLTATNDGGSSSETKLAYITVAAAVPAFVAGANAINTPSKSSLTIAKPSGTASGDVLIAQIMKRQVSEVPTPPAGWTLLNSITVDGVPNYYAHFFYKVAGGSEGADYTFTTVDSSFDIFGHIVTYTDVDTVSVPGGIDGYVMARCRMGVGDDPQVVTGPATVTNNSRLVALGNIFYGIGTGWTTFDAMRYEAGTDPRYRSYDKAIPTAGPTGSFTLANAYNGYAAGIIVALRAPL